MPITRTVTALAWIALSLTGCKVKVSVPYGGAVSSESGSLQCQEMTDCTLEVKDGGSLVETFVATPNQGFKFYGWQNGTLCRNEMGPCQVSVPKNLSAFDLTVELVPEFGRPLRNDITLNPLPRSVLLNSGGFEVKELYQHTSAEKSHIWYAGSGDLDSDGNPELLVSGWTFQGWEPDLPAQPADLFVFEASKDKTRYVPTEQLLGRSETFGTTFIRVADFDQNGDQDVLIVGHNESPFQFTPNILLLNNNGTFSERRIEPEMAMHEGSLGDFNNDGYLDFVGGAYMADIPLIENDPSSGKSALMLFINDKNGGFEAHPIRYTIASNGLTANEFLAKGGEVISPGSAAAMGDIDGDQLTEIVVVDSPEVVFDSVFVPDDNPSEMSTESWIIDDIAFEDGLAYGKKIALPGSYFANDSHFDDNPFLPAGGMDMSHEVQVELFDFDNDGDLDILICAMIWAGGDSQYSPAGVLQFLANDGEGNFADVTNETLYNYNLGNAASHDMTIMDVNHDGFKDIVMSERGYFDMAPRKWTTFTNDVAQPIPYAWANEILVNTGSGKFVSTFWKGFNDLSRRREAILDKYAPKFEPYSLIEEPYFPYMLGDGRLGFVTMVGAYPASTIFFDIRAKKKLGTGPNGKDSSAEGAPGFSEYYYLTENPDVVEAIEAGDYKTGLDHYLKVGRSEGRFASAHEVN